MLRRVGNVWVYQCKLTGKTWSRSTGETNKRRAEIAAKLLHEEAQLLRGQPGALQDLASATVTEVARIEDEVSKRAAERASTHLVKFREWLGSNPPLHKITTKMIDDYQKHMLEKRSADTAHHAIDTICRLLRENGIQVIKPRRRSGTVTQSRPFTKDELEKFFASCPESLKPLFMLLLVSGARLAELVPSDRSTHVALLKTELDEETSTVTIRQAKLLRNAAPKIRQIQVPAEVVKMAVEAGKRTEGPHVFQPHYRISRGFDQILKKAGIAKFDPLGRRLTIHSLRHTFGTLMAEAVGSNPFIVKQLLGHSTLAMTDRYCHAKAPAIVIDLASMGVSNGCKKADEAKVSES